MRQTSNSPQVIAKIDRVVLTSSTSLEAALAILDTFRTEADYCLRNLDADLTKAPYARKRTLISDKTYTRVFIQHRPRFRRLAPLRVAIVPDDAKGLRCSELALLLTAFESYKLVVIEVAIDVESRPQ